MLYRACTQAIILAACKIKCSKKEQEENIFQCYIIHGVRRYVECNDNNNDIPYSFKLLWSGMFVIEVINHVIMAVLRYSPTTTSHTRYTSCVVHTCFSMDREIIMRVPTNSLACKLNTRDSYTSCSHACAIYFLVLSAYESRLVTQFYKSNATSALV